MLEELYISLICQHHKVYRYKFKVWNTYLIAGNRNQHFCINDRDRSFECLQSFYGKFAIFPNVQRHSKCKHRHRLQHLCIGYFGKFNIIRIMNNSRLIWLIVFLVIIYTQIASFSGLFVCISWTEQIDVNLFYQVFCLHIFWYFYEFSSL